MTADPIRTRKDADVWKWASEVGLQDCLNLHQLVERARLEVIQRLEALLQKGENTAECQSAASAIGTLTELGRRVRENISTEPGPDLPKSDHHSR